jgi:integral membrane protein (TIGR00529 family)
VVGGAMLSAPLVAEASDDLKLSAERRTFLNFWFRHVWEYALPTFPAVFLTAGIVGIPVADLVLVNLPLTTASILVGIVFGFKGIRPFISAHASLTPAGMGRYLLTFVWSLLPFFLVILLTLWFDLHLVYSLALITAGTLVLYRLPPASLAALIRRSFSVELALLIYGIMLFKEMLAASSAMAGIAADLSRMGMPTAVLAALIPAVIAFITGYTTAFVGLSFPVLLPLLPTDGSGVYYVMLALASGICAHLLSPMHACYVQFEKSL